MSDIPAWYAAYREQDAWDRRHAAWVAALMADQFTDWQTRADAVYAWLRRRGTVAAHTLVFTAGAPQEQTTEGAPVGTPSNPLALIDTQADSLTVSALDSKGFATPDGPFTWAIDGSSVASIADNGDGTATVTAAAPGSATVTATDPDGVSASLAVTVSPGAAASLVITPGTPADQPPAG